MDLSTRRILGYVFITASVVCMAPTLLAVVAALLIGCISGLVAAAPDVNPYIVLLISVVFSVLSAYAVTILGLVLHTVGVAVSVGAFFCQQRVLGLASGALHALLLLVDIAFWVGMFVLGATSG